jgi:hypothetical protein
MAEKKRFIDVGDLLEKSLVFYKKYFRIFLIAVVVAFVVNVGTIFLQMRLQEQFQNKFLRELGLNEAEISAVKDVYQQGGDWENLSEEQKNQLVAAIGSNFEGKNPEEVFKELLVSLGSSVILPGIGLGLLAGLIIALVNIGVILAIKRIEEKKEASFESIATSLKGRFWSVIWIMILNSVLVMLWSLLLIIPGIIMAIYYSFSLYTLIFEDQRGMQALNRSKELVRDYWWGVLGRYLLLGLLVSIVVMATTILATILLKVSGVNGQARLDLGISILAQAVTSLLTPLYIIYPYFMYKDLVRIKNPSISEEGDQPVMEQPAEAS